LPVVAASGVRTDVLFERLKAGEDLKAVAEDFSLDRAAVEAAVAWEKAARRAA